MKLIKLNEFYSVSTSILIDTIENEEGIKKEILENLKNNYGNNVSLDVIKQKLNELIDNGTETGILPSIEYDINKFNFYIQHREEIENILSENKWIDDSKSKWNSDLELMDVISEAVNYSVIKSAEKLIQEVFN